jgi:hypothetical protein
VKDEGAAEQKRVKESIEGYQKDIYSGLNSKSVTV